MTPTKTGEITIYSDGCCLGNPGPGGYGAIVIDGGKPRELSGGYKLTTNNRMELTGAIVALESLGGRQAVTLYTDSKYVVDAMRLGWAKKWQANGWRRNKKEPALNPDLWQRLLELCERLQVDFRWVKGHHTSAGNNRCDALANEAARKPGLPPDRGYQPAPKQRKLF